MPTKACLGCIALLSTRAGAEPPLHFTTEDSPPSNYLDGDRIIGSATDLLRAVTERAKIPVTIDLMPWARAYQSALDEPDTCVFSTTVTEARRPLFKWVTPVSHNHWVLFARPDSPITLDRLENAKPLLIGVYRGDVREDFFQRLGGYRLTSAPDLSANIRQLLAGHVDLVAGGTDVDWLMRLNGIARLKPVLQFKTAELGLACNRAVPDEIIQRLNDALAALTAEGVTAAITARYGSD